MTRVWLITVGEPLPTDPGAPRLLRAGLLAGLLHARGHEVVWWTSDFDHQRKRTREAGAAGPGYRIEMLRGRPYAKNVSLARIRNHREVAADFRRRAEREPRPDVVLASFPTIELCEEAIAYGRRRGVPVAIDIRDLWPDVFLELLPEPLRGLGALPLRGMFDASRRVCRDATAVLGITDAYVDWALARGGRSRGPWDLAVPLGYESRLPPADALERARADWDARGVGADRFTLCFFGTLGRQFDIPTVLAAARLLQDRPVRFVICGDGDRAAQYREAAASLPNVVMPGWVDAAAIRALMERSAAGLAPYRCVPNFQMNMPNKVVEYLAGGLPLLSCLTGELERLIDASGCGLVWREGDPASLAAAVERLRADAAGRERMAAAAKAVFESRFVADVVYGRLIEHLDALAATAVPAARAA